MTYAKPTPCTMCHTPARMLIRPTQAPNCVTATSVPACPLHTGDIILDEIADGNGTTGWLVTVL